MTIFGVKDRETISSLTTAVGFTSTKLTAALMYARIQALGGNVRFTVDGTTPTASVGLKLTENSTVEIWGTTALANFRCIDDGGTASLEVVYFSR